jgi:hypothetical protein
MCTVIKNYTKSHLLPTELHYTPIGLFVIELTVTLTLKNNNDNKVDFQK